MREHALAVPDRWEKPDPAITSALVEAVGEQRQVSIGYRSAAGNTHSFEGGHYISVVGYRDNGHTVTIADSANPNMASYRISVDNLADWIATRGYSAS